MWSRRLYSDIETWWAAAQGWCSLEKAQTLASIIIANRPKLVVEIGVWYGKSALPMAIACKAVGSKMVAIDPWKADASIEGQGQQDREWWGRQQIHEAAYHWFMATVDRCELQETIEVCRYPSQTVDPPENIGLLHLDGNHGERAIDDVRRFAPNIVPGGYLVADDIDWTGGSVKRAIDLLPAMGLKELYRVVKHPETPDGFSDNWAVFQKL